ncbi:MAG TPA: rhodanese-like domain-containing protein [Bacteroidota bacterium]|nr:rhodanese-like domain-containing protein [Bacteroidota bacterium]
MKQTGRESIAILLLATFLALGYNWFSPHGLALIRHHASGISVSDSSLFFSSPPTNPIDTNLHASQSEQALDSVGPGNVKVIAPLHERALAMKDSIEKAGGSTEAPEYRLVTLEQFKRLLREHRGMLIDARESDNYQRGHIRSARSIPEMEFDKHFGELAVLPRDTLVMIYCNNAECPLGRALAHDMSIMHFTNLFLFDDGWDGWVNAGLPVDSTRMQERR